jgi:hypothetical protein
VGAQMRGQVELVGQLKGGHEGGKQGRYFPIKTRPLPLHTMSSDPPSPSQNPPPPNNAQSQGQSSNLYL